MREYGIGLLIIPMALAAASGAQAGPGGGTQTPIEDVVVATSGPLTTASGAVFAARVNPISTASSANKQIGCKVKRYLAESWQDSSWMATCRAVMPNPTGPQIQLQCDIYDSEMIALAESINIDSWIQFQALNSGDGHCTSLIVDNNSRYWQAPHDVNK